MTTSALIGRIEVERGRLRDALAAVDRASKQLPKFGEAARASLANTVRTLDGRWAQLTRTVGKRGISTTQVEELAKLSTATDRLVTEAYGLATGVVLREHGLDDGACELADLLIEELAGLIDPRLARPTVPASAESLHRAADIVRLRLPGHDLWDLPVMAHEFGHLVSAHLKLYDPIEDQVLEVGQRVLGDWTGLSGQQAEELFCDLFAIYALGPSYACTLLLHRLDPTMPSTVQAGSTHPPDAVRAAVVLEVLRLLTKDEPRLNRYRTMTVRLTGAWDAIRQVAPAEAQLPDAERERFGGQAALVLAFVEENLKGLRYRWSSEIVLGLAGALQGNGESGVDDLPNIRDVLSAAWMLRLNAWHAGKVAPRDIEARGRELIAKSDDGR
jgi:hypothetical protein